MADNQEIPVNLNILLRGQSNAIILGQQTNSAGTQAIVAEVQRLLGFDGINQTVTLAFASDDLRGYNTAAGGTALLGDWLSPNGGDWWQQGWTENFLQQRLLNYIDHNMTAEQRADPSAVLWLHNEYDSRRSDLTAAEWESALRFDAALVRQAFGHDDIPYIFIEPIPYVAGTNAGTQAIRLGMQALAADPAFGARIGAQASDLDMNADFGDSGGGHMTPEDALTIAARTALSLAELWAQYALPGSPVDLAGGNLNNTGPLAVQAAKVGDRQLSVSFVFDEATGFGPVDPDAAAGVGWSVRLGGTVLEATGLVVTGSNSVLLSFAADLPPGGRLYYNYGIGKLAGAGGTGQGNALYDDGFMPAHAPASGLLIGAAPIAPGKVISGTAGDDTLPASDNGDTLIGGAGTDYMLGGVGSDSFVLSIGDGGDRIGNFVPGMDRLQFGAGILRGDVTTEASVFAGESGLKVTYSTGGDFVFLVNVDALQPGDLVFTALPPVVPKLIPGTPGRDEMGAGAGGDTIIGGKGDDYMVGGRGADEFRFSLGDGNDYVDQFQPGRDKLLFSGGLTEADIRFGSFPINNVPGLVVWYGAGGDFVFLAHVTGLQPGDIHFGGAPGTVRPAAPHDYDGDYKSDVVLRQADGSVALWQMNGATITSGVVIANPGTAWTSVPAGDFDGDGRADMLFRNVDGSLAQWRMDGVTTVGGFFLTNPGADWRAVSGSGDFNHDGRSDILFRHDNGDIAIWQMNGEVTLSAAVVASPGTAWQVAGTGDFNGDNKTDILFRHEDGTIAQWQMDGTTIASSSVLTSLDPGMSVAGTGDFSGDGRDGILVRQADGTVTMWTMDGGTIAGSIAVVNPGMDWRVVGIGDYNGDGKADILLQNTDGSIAQWLMDGAAIIGGAVIVNPGTEWQVA
jgi:Ca2+-binding RTX toxin-like protein